MAVHSIVEKHGRWTGKQTLLSWVSIPILSGAVLLSAWVLFGAIAPPDRSSALDRGFSNLFPRTAEYDFAPPEPGTYGLPALKTAPGGVVVDKSGLTVDLAETLDGRISLVSFVYLMCSDTNGCPLAHSTLFNVFDGSSGAPALKDHLQLVTISFDPERDTPDALESFAYPVVHDPDAAQKLDWRFFTTTGQTDLKPILDGFGQAVMPSAEEDVINHLLRMYLVDSRGRIRNVYGLGMIDPRLLMTDVETLMIEEARL